LNINNAIRFGASADNVINFQ